MYNCHHIPGPPSTLLCLLCSPQRTQSPLWEHVCSCTSGPPLPCTMSEPPHVPAMCPNPTLQTPHSFCKVHLIKKPPTNSSHRCRCFFLGGSTVIFLPLGWHDTSFWRHSSLRACIPSLISLLDHQFLEDWAFVTSQISKVLFSLLVFEEGRE